MILYLAACSLILAAWFFYDAVIAGRLERLEDRVGEAERALWPLR